MNRKITALVISASAVLLGLTIWYQIDENNLFFNPGIKYYSVNLNYMGVIFKSLDDVEDMRNGFSLSADCPWGYEHRGFDVFFENETDIIAAAPGQVEKFELYDFGPGIEFRYSQKLWIRFNRSISVEYHFECWTDDWDEYLYQVSQINVSIGDWVKKGDILGKVINFGDGAHIHHCVLENNIMVCMNKFYDATGYNTMLTLIHRSHPDWEFCYS